MNDPCILHTMYMAISQQKEEILYLYMVLNSLRGMANPKFLSRDKVPLDLAATPYKKEHDTDPHPLKRLCFYYC